MIEMESWDKIGVEWGVGLRLEWNEHKIACHSTCDCLFCPLPPAPSASYRQGLE